MAKKTYRDRLIATVVEFGRCESELTKELNRKGRTSTKARLVHRRAVAAVIAMVLENDPMVSTTWVTDVTNEIVEALG